MLIYPFLICYLTFFFILKWVPNIPRKKDWMAANHFVLAVGSLIYLISQFLEDMLLPWYAGFLQEYLVFVESTLSWYHLILPFLFLLSLVISLSYFKQKNRANLKLNNRLSLLLFLLVCFYIFRAGQGIQIIKPGWHTSILPYFAPENFYVLFPIVFLANFLLVYLKILPEFRKK